MAITFASCSGFIVYPGVATNNTANVKTGTAEVTIWFGITFGDHDLGIATAARNGKITKVSTVDFKVQAGFFHTTYTTIVTGE